MRNLDHVFDDLNERIEKAFTYIPMTDEQYQISCVNDIIEWAAPIQSLWNGDDPGTPEDRAAQAADIIDKCNELKELIAGMEEL